MHHEPVLVPDITLLIQMGLFFASYFVLNFLVFKPYLALLKARREQTVGLRAEAEKAKAETEKLSAQYEVFVASERKKTASWADEERRKIQQEEHVKTQAARDTAAKASSAARTAVEEEKRRVRKTLESSMGEFVSGIVSKMLGRKVQVSSPTRASSEAEART